MSISRQILAAIFDMDGLLIDSEPLWDRAESEVMKSLGVDINRRVELPDTLGHRTDMIVKLWYKQQPWFGLECKKVADLIISKTISLIEKERPIFPGVKEVLTLCKTRGLKIGLASASPLYMLEKVLNMFQLRESFDALASAERLPYSKPHPHVYINCAKKLGVDPIYCVAIEDSVNGMIAAKAARMRTIVVPSEKNQDDPRFALADIKLKSLQSITVTQLYG